MISRMRTGRSRSGSRAGPMRRFSGRIEKILPAGQDTLPSEALGYAAGGSMPTRPGSAAGQPRPRSDSSRSAFGPMSEATSDEGRATLFTGQRVIARVSHVAEASADPMVSVGSAALPEEVPHLDGSGRPVQPGGCSMRTCGTSLCPRAPMPSGTRVRVWSVGWCLDKGRSFAGHRTCWPWRSPLPR